MNNIFLKKTIAANETVILNPFVYTKPSVRASVLAQIYLLILQLFALFASRSYAALFVILTTVIASVSSEFVNIKKYRRHHDSLAISIVQGIFVGMFLPESFPLLEAFCVIFFVFVITKNAFETFSGSWVNPVAVSVAISYFTASRFFPESILSQEFSGVVNAGEMLFQNGVLKPLNVDFSLAPFLNEKVFSLFGVSIPTGYISLFLDSGSPIPAFRFNSLTILSSLILFSLDMISCVIPLFAIAMYAVLVRIFGSFFAGGAFFQGDILFALFSSGVIFCALFVLPWYGTIPYTTLGRIFYGSICGIIFFVVAGIGASAVGSIFSVLISNTMSPFVQIIENTRINKKVITSLLPKVNVLKETENA